MLIKTEKSDVIMNFLKQRFLVNENIIGIIENLPKAEIYVDDVENPKGVLVKKDDYMHYTYTEDECFINELCEGFFREGFFGFSGLEGELAEKIRQRSLLGWASPCTLYYMPKEKLDLSLKKNPTERIRLKDAEVVDHFYQFRGPETLEVIKRDISNRPSSAVYIDDELVCWVLIHDDNSMGIMYTKEEHRRKGYAVDVTIDLANQIIQSGKIPFIQIIEGNGMSPGLARKCGFVEAGKADWFGIIAGNPKELREANDHSKKQFLTILPEALHGYVYKENSQYSCLYSFLYNFKYQPSLINSLRLVKAETESEKILWAEITSMTLPGAIELSKLSALLLEASADDRYNRYLLLKDGMAIAASLTQKDEEDDRGIYLLSSLPDYDNQDIMKALITETIQYEKSKDCYFMVTQTEQRFVDLFKELGFRESHRI